MQPSDSRIVHLVEKDFLFTCICLSNRVITCQVSTVWLPVKLVSQHPFLCVFVCGWSGCGCSVCVDANLQEL